VQNNINNLSSQKAVVLLSGGLDSTTVLSIASSLGYEIYAMSFDYGQKNKFEIEKAKLSAEKFEVAEHKIVKIDLRVFGGSSLTTDREVERRSESEIGQGVPSTYVPVRNTLFLSYALAWAEVLNSTDIFIGVNAVDTSGYPDCRPEFISAFEALANLATKIATVDKLKIRIHAPLQEMSKTEIIKTGMSLGVDYSHTSSCYDPVSIDIACGTCDACVLRQRGFLNAGFLDPLAYEKRL
jgi:7-cyano-7-deazaguanine synthase